MRWMPLIQTNMACEQKDTLMEANSKAAKLYALATGRLTEAQESGSRSAYEDARQLCEHAEGQCESARLELEAHTSTHGC